MVKTPSRAEKSGGRKKSGHSRDWFRLEHHAGRKFDFQALALDVQPFLFDPLDVRRVVAFPQIIRDATL